MSTVAKSLYLDECGNTDLEHEKDGASEYFIIAGVIIDSEKEEKIRAGVEGIKTRLRI